MMFENVREVDLNVTNGRVRVEAWENDCVEVNYVKHGDVDVRVEVVGKSLLIEEKPRKRFHVFGGKEGWAEIEVKVPKNVLVSAKSVNGEITAVGVILRDAITVNGEIELRNCEARFIKSVNGDIRAQLPVAGPLDVSTVNGNVEVLIEELEGDVNVGCVNGEITLRLTDFCDAKIETTKVNGDVELVGISDDTIGTGEFLVRVKTVNGDVRVEVV